MTTVADERERIAFAEEAAAHFGAHPEHWSYSTDGLITPGGLIALRWGLDRDCVLVLRLHEYEQPVNFQNIVSGVKP
jgi:hypothetical protein